MPRPKKRQGRPRTCPNCGAVVSGPANKKYCSRKCGVEFWDTVNPKAIAFLQGRRSAPKTVTRPTGLSDMIERKLSMGHGEEDDY
jgi:hypothetical protein